VHTLRTLGLPPCVLTVCAHPALQRCARRGAAPERHPALGRAAAPRAQVTSNLHRQQLVRAIKRVILGLGAAPGAPRRLRCQPLTCAAVACAWDAPAEPGHPPFHKFKLERLAPGGAGGPAAWATAGGELDGDQRQFVDAGLAEVRRGPGAAQRSGRWRTPRAYTSSPSQAPAERAPGRPRSRGGARAAPLQRRDAEPLVRPRTLAPPALPGPSSLREQQSADLHAACGKVQGQDGERWPAHPPLASTGKRARPAAIGPW